MLIFRRWKVALPLLLLAIGATAYVALTAKPDYTMTSYLQFVPAKLAQNDNPTEAAMRNPWNQLGLFNLGQSAVYATQDQGFLEELKAGGHTNNFTLTITYPNPIITVEVVGKTPADTQISSKLVLDRLQESAQRLQKDSGVQDRDIIASQQLDNGQNLVPSSSKVKRAIFAVAAAGLILTAGGTVGFDAFMRRRSRRRKQGEGEEPSHEPTPGTAGGQMPALPTAPAGQADPDQTMVHPYGLVPSGNPPERPAAPNGTAPSASMERTAIVVRRGASAVKPAATTKSTRPPQTATYRSVNAQNEPGGEEPDPAPVATNGNSTTTSDVRVVLQPKWVGGENGGKSH